MSLNQVDILLSGVGLLILAGALLHWGRHPCDPLREISDRANRVDWACVLLVVLAYMIGAGLASVVAAANAPQGLSQDDLRDLQGALGTSGSFIAGGLVCVLAGHLMFRSGLAGFGLTVRRAGRDVVRSIATLLVLLPLVTGLLWISEFLILHTLGREYIKDHASMRLLENPTLPGWVAPLVVLTAGILAPIAEESFFRGILQTRFQSATGSRWRAVALASACFGLVHSEQPAAILPMFVIGMVLGYTYERTGSLIGPILVHALFNGKMLLWYSLHSAG